MSTARERARWLTAVADALDAAAPALVPIAHRETHLDEVRLRGEVARTTGQLRLFADVVLEGSWVEAIIDHAVPSATPPRPDLRRMLRPIGPVAVFAASNFPFAFSVAGGDTASALAAGCPVVVKAHPGHPELSRATARVVDGALAQAGAPAGTFALVEGYEQGIALARDASIRAIAFTGSLAGGRALHDIAASRADPIPFFGELGSINPVVVTPAADAARGAELAAGLAASFTLGSGQLCTKPGVVLVPRDSTFLKALPAHVPTDERVLLTTHMAESFVSGAGALAAVPGVRLVAGGRGGIEPTVLAADARVAWEHPALLDEVFGPVTVVLEYDDDLLQVLRLLEGALTATLHAEPGEDVDEVLEILSERAGRVLFAGWPTGVAVNWSQHHGGPWPATTSQFTSVGATAIRRFLRPIAYQDAPERLLPPELHEDNPLGIPRRVDGVLRLHEHPSSERANTTSPTGPGTSAP